MKFEKINKFAAMTKAELSSLSSVTGGYYIATNHYCNTTTWAPSGTVGSSDSYNDNTWESVSNDDGGPK